MADWKRIAGPPMARTSVTVPWMRAILATGEYSTGGATRRRGSLMPELMRIGPLGRSGADGGGATAARDAPKTSPAPPATPPASEIDGAAPPRSDPGAGNF